MSDENTNSRGVGVVGFLGVAFTVLKLCNVINWSWWWVLLPFYGPISLLIILAIIVASFSD